jgi:hypothetical protein
MTAQVELPGVGKATTCEAYGTHRPQPLRFVWHHVLPQACGGKTERDNLVSLCDGCHYSCHVIMWLFGHGGLLGGTPHGTKGQRAIAQRGYDEALAAGTADKIPKEA